MLSAATCCSVFSLRYHAYTHTGRDLCVKCSRTTHRQEILRCTCTDKVCTLSKRAVQWPHPGVQRHLTNIRPPDLLDAVTYLKCNMLKKGVRTCDDASYMHWPFLWYTFLNICDDRQANIFHSWHWTNQWLCVSKRTNMNQDSWNFTCLKEWCTVKSDMIRMTWNQVRIYSLLLSVLWHKIWSI